MSKQIEFSKSNKAKLCFTVKEKIIEEQKKESYEKKHHTLKCYKFFNANRYSESFSLYGCAVLDFVNNQPLCNKTLCNYQRTYDDDSPEDRLSREDPIYYESVVMARNGNN